MNERVIEGVNEKRICLTQTHSDCWVIDSKARWRTSLLAMGQISLSRRYSALLVANTRVLSPS